MPSDRSEIKDTYRIIVLFWLMFVLVLIPTPSFAQDKVIATYTYPTRSSPPTLCPTRQSNRFKLQCFREVSLMIEKFCLALSVAICGMDRPISRMSFGC